MRILTIPQTAALLQVSVRTVYDALRRGRLPGRKVGRSWRIPEAALLESLSHAGEGQEVRQ